MNQPLGRGRGKCRAAVSFASSLDMARSVRRRFQPEYLKGVQWFPLLPPVGDVATEDRKMPREVCPRQQWRSLLCFSLSMFLCHEASGQEILFRIEDDDPLIHLGNSVAAVGDVNDDRILDFTISGTEDESDTEDAFGFVRVFSGHDAKILYTIETVFPNTGFGEDRNLVGLGDLNGDGFGEIAIGTPWGTEFEPFGSVEIYSGRNGHIMRTHFGERFRSLGEEIASLGDLNFDEVPDYAVSTAEKGAEGGYVAVFSGKTGDEIGGFTTSEPVWFWSIAGPGDLNDDGRADIALGLWSEVDPWRRGQVRVVSGELFGGDDASGARIDIDSDDALQATLIKVDGRTGEAAGPSGIEALGQGLNRVGDVDGDGTPDVGVGTGAGDDAVILSGADGSRLHEWTSDKLKFSQLVVETAGIGDVNDDGFRDVIVGRTGSVRLMSGSDGALLAEVLEPERGDDLGEEIAAIGDLNGDGISEVLAGAPGGGYALVISFGPGVQIQITLNFETGKPVISWRPQLTTGVLESSPDLLNWEPVVKIDEVEESRYPIPIGTNEQEQYYRIRFGE